MKVSELSKLNFRLVEPGQPDLMISDGYTSDLLSDVMRSAPAQCVLITIQAHKNTIAVASLVNAAAVVVCHERPIPADMLEAARAEKIALYVTVDSQYLSSAKLYQALHL